ncbi:MAG: hypothetical protein V3U07_04780 [Nitrospirales bacterium]
MFNSIIKILPILLLSFVLSCAGSSSGEKPGDYSYTATIGPVTAYDYQDKTRLSLNKYQYQIERNEDYGNRKYLETMWKYRTPFEDERQLGVVRAKTRIILHVTPRMRSVAGRTLHRVQFIGENLVQFMGVELWQTAPLTDMCKEYFKRWANELKTEFSTSIRRY